MDQSIRGRYQQATEHGRAIVLYGRVDCEMVRHFEKRAAGSMGGEAFIILDTPGGEVNAGLSLYQEMRAFAEGRTVYLIARTRVHSIGMLLLTAVPLEFRVAVAPTTFLLHPASIPPRQFELKTPEDDAAFREYERDAAEIRRIDRIIAERIVAATRCDAEAVSAFERSGEYIAEQRAVELGFVSAVLT